MIYSVLNFDGRIGLGIRSGKCSSDGLQNTMSGGGHMSENRSDSNQISELEDLIRQCQTVEASLRESREIYKTVLQQSFAAIYIVQNGKFCAVNFKVADYSGYPIEELIGMKTDSVVIPMINRMSCAGLGPCCAEIRRPRMYTGSSLRKGISAGL